MTLDRAYHVLCVPREASAHATKAQDYSQPNSETSFGIR